MCQLRSVFAELWRVLRLDGNVFLNLGDSYNGSGGAGGDYSPGGLKEGQPRYPGRKVAGLKPKDLMMIPHRVALALQADGWWVRQDNIWAKKNSMPESVTDRTSRAHEYVFHLTKNSRYFYDAVAVAEESLYPGDARHLRTDNKKLHEPHSIDKGSREKTGNPTGVTRNRRSVWSIASQPYAGAHFATMPPALAEICIKATTSEHGCCADCGAPWARLVEKSESLNRPAQAQGHLPESGRRTNGTRGNRTANVGQYAATATLEHWRPTCACNAVVIPCTVLDPFNGSGTTGAVACSHGRNYIGIDLNADYIELAHARIAEAINASGRTPVVRKGRDTDLDNLPMFQEATP